MDLDGREHTVAAEREEEDADGEEEGADTERGMPGMGRAGGRVGKSAEQDQEHGQGGGQHGGDHGPPKNLYEFFKWFYKFR